MKNCGAKLENEFLDHDEIIALTTKKVVFHNEPKNLMKIALEYVELQCKSNALDVLVMRI